MAKSTKVEAQKRTRLVLEMLLQSTPPVDIVQYGIANWGITEAGVWKYITAAYDIMKELAKQEHAEVYAHNLAQRQYIKNKAMKDGDYRLAHEVLRDEAKLLDLYPVEKKQLELVEKELSQALDALQQRLEPDVYQKVISILAEETGEAETDDATG